MRRLRDFLAGVLRLRTLAYVLDGLRARVAALEPLPARVAALEPLPARVAALEPLPARVAALDGLLPRVAALERRPIYDVPVGFSGDFYERHDRPRDMQEYWSRHNVTNHKSFASAAESLAYLHYRNKQYPGYIDLLPVAGWDGKTVLDYGCGPGNDLVGFAHYSRPRRLIGVDVSPTSLEQANARLSLHGASAEFVHVPYGSYSIPLADGSVDYVHCSGVLMLIEEPVRILREFRRVLRPGGEARLMVYNYDSLWVHLYVAYVIQLELGVYSSRTIREAFARSTDGEYCPFVHVWTPTEVERMAAEAGFVAEFIGAALSLWELHVFPMRFKALMDPRLPEESRDFLLELTLDEHGYPSYRGKYAGIDASFRLTMSGSS
jgi:ubiquinone/menaquinone biosynthesis C-methylase UbiE